MPRLDEGAQGGLAGFEGGLAVEGEALHVVEGPAVAEEDGEVLEDLRRLRVGGVLDGRRMLVQRRARGPVAATEGVGEAGEEVALVGRCFVGGDVRGEGRLGRGRARCPRRGGGR